MNIRHLSPSALEAFDWCPMHRYAKSYRDNVRMVPNYPVWFGTALHSGIEAAYRGQDWELEFTKAWRLALVELEASEGTPMEPRGHLMARGMDLIASVLALAIPGDPEWAFNEKLPGLDVPVKGRIDLVDTVNHVVTDWKSSNRGWSTAMAAKKKWQPVIYSLVYEKQHGVIPEFQYVIMPVLGHASAYVLTANRTEEFRAAAMLDAQRILERIRADDIGDCTCPSWAKVAA